MGPDPTPTPSGTPSGTPEPAPEPLPDEIADRVGPDARVVGSEVVLPPVVPQVAGGRREARERAVHLLYESRMKTRSGPETVADQVKPP